ncbi:MAG: hypothetical protein LBD97_04035 [Bifidobacteriaceae bacterium]|nr:hypothetical protein [Bifidobacteriaceae bacterium]
MSANKERRTLTLDRDVAAAFDQSNLSGEVNQILKEEIGRRKARSALAELLGELDAQLGPPDPGLVQRYRQTLR